MRLRLGKVVFYTAELPRWQVIFGTWRRLTWWGWEDGGLRWMRVPLRGD